MYIYIYTQVCLVISFVCICICIRICICICIRNRWRGRGRSPSASARRAPRIGRKGTNGVSTNGVTAFLTTYFDRGTFWVLPLTYFYLPKSARVYLFSPICQNSLLLQRSH